MKNEMSKVKRLKILKSLILELHAGGDKEKLRIKFKKILSKTDASEIASMEQSLIDEGTLTPEQITRRYL
jgi:DUF438 domain-containing protein